MRFAALALSTLLAICVVLAPARAVEPDEILADPAMESRARQISSGLRCLVCQNQSIDDSNALLARDLRVVVRERLKRGDSDETVRAYVVERYGEFVLLKPPLSVRTVLLWATPLILLALTGLAAWRGLSARRAQDTAPVQRLSPEEEVRLAALTKDKS